MSGRAAKHQADIGVLYAAWWLHRAHGEDTYAVDMLWEWGGASGMRRFQRLARKEGYRFARGFWPRALTYCVNVN